MSCKDVDKSVEFPVLEENVLNFWKNEKIFEKSIDNNKNNEEFVFYDGPPFATGLPHYGHILPGTIKDIIPRFMTMKGKLVKRKWGWDCHGLPVENLIEQELGLKNKVDLLNYGIDKFNEACRSSVLRYTSEWEKTVERMGRWVDFKNSYKTMDPQFMETIWWVFKSLWEKELIYEGFKILPYCTRCTTPLSNFETNQGYKDVQDPAVTVAFTLKNHQHRYILAWTTTPWTLPANTGLAIGEQLDYAIVKESGKEFVLALDLVPKFFKEGSGHEIISKIKGKELIGERYEPLFPYFSDIDPQFAFRVVAGHHVTTESGTGIVHIAPGFGEDDAEIGKKEKLPALCPVDAEGKYTAEVTDYMGIHVKQADKLIIKRLKDEGKLIKHDTYQHSYPHCWRCDEPLIYKAVSSWFVNIEAIKQKMIESNSNINWTPDHIKNGRFGKWIEGARDWAISRNRYWGTPIPVWKCEECGKVICVGSIKELEELSGKSVNDLHLHYIDKLDIKCECGKNMKRVEEVLDCWFESGAMPYAQKHYPFENKKEFEEGFPADFIAEGLDQTRGWFYTLVVLGSALFGKAPMKSVVVNGLVLAEDGRKMSKRLKNYPEVDYVFNKYGADALRLFLMNSAAVKAGELLFSETGVKDVLKRFHLPLWNTYSFFVTYANVDKWDPTKDMVNSFDNPLDIWIISFTEKLVTDIETALSSYDFQTAVKALYGYIDSMTNWYIRRSRRRFWKSEDDLDKKQAYSALYKSLIKFCIVSAPIAPFLVDEIYTSLRTQDMPASVHLCPFPQENKSVRNYETEKEMELIQQVVEMGRSLRSKVGINLRRPLNNAYLVTRNGAELSLLNKMESIIKEELNVKSVTFENEEEKLVSLSCKANFRVLGKKVGKNMKTAAELIAAFGSAEAAALENGKTVTINLDGAPVILTGEDILIERKEKENLTVMNEGSITIGLDTHLTQELIEEGISREFIRHIQNLRKENNYDVVDRIIIKYSASERIAAAINNWQKTIKEETLCNEIIKAAIKGEPVSVDDEDVILEITR